MYLFLNGLVIFVVRGTLNAVPLNVTPTPSGNPAIPLMSLQSIDDIGEEESDEDNQEGDNDSEESTDHQPDTTNGVITSTTTMSAVICQCRQLLPFMMLSNTFEDKCSALFQVVYQRSCMGFNEKTKTIEVQVSCVLLLSRVVMSPCEASVESHCSNVLLHILFVDGI